MSDKKFFKNKNRNKNRSNRNKNNGPSPVARLDDSIIMEVSLMLELGITEEVIQKKYHLCYSQIDYIRKHPQNWDIWESLTKNKEE